MRTLVVSDLHIGARDRFSVIERPAVLEVMLKEIDRCDRLVLLGDLVELLEAEAGRTLRVARPILRAIGARVGPDRQIIYLPGNHDRGAIRGWIRATGPAIETESVVPPSASPLLAAVVEALAPAPVEVRYPGVWLSDRIWAHHGHYLNRYLHPDQAYGVMPRRRERTPAGRSRPIDFEPRRLGGGLGGGGGGLRSLVRYMPLRAALGLEDAGELARAATMPPTGELRPVSGGPVSGAAGPRSPGYPDEPLVPINTFKSRLHDRLLHPSLSPIIAYLLSLQVRSHSIPAVARAAHDLGIEPEYLLFGHVHRRGPIEGEDLDQWNAWGPKILNTGSWRWEPVLVQRVSPPHPYWPGGAIVIDELGEPSSVGLLDGLSREDLTDQNG